jgi:hypothetical protein
MKLIFQKLYILILMIEDSLVTFTRNLSAHQNITEKIVLLHTTMRVEKEQNANELLFSKAYANSVSHFTKGGLFLLLMGLSLSAFPQKQIIVEVDTLSKANHSMVVDIPQATAKDIQKNWVKYAAVGSKEKAQLVNGENVQPNAMNKNISPNSFTTYSKVLETNEGIRLTVWLTQNNTPLGSSETNSGTDLAIQKFVRDFAVAQYRLAIQNELKAEQNKQKVMEKQLAASIAAEEKSVKTIQTNDRSNQRSDDAIETTKSDIDNSSDKINNQKAMVNGTSSDASTTKAAQKSLGNLEDDKKDLQKKNEARSKQIDSRNKANRSEERSLVIAKQNVALKAADIEKQKALVLEVQTKLSNVK